MENALRQKNIKFESEKIKKCGENKKAKEDKEYERKTKKIEARKKCKT